MKVFLCWSGSSSKALAEALGNWLPCVLQSLEPFVSEDIDKGDRWASVLTQELAGAAAGIVCLTPDALSGTWIHFEAGALSNRFTNARVCTVLFGVEHADVKWPLAQFQHTKAADKADVLKLVETLNAALGEKEARLDAARLTEAFEVWWPRFEERLKSIDLGAPVASVQRDVRDMVEELLGLVRSLQRQQPESSRHILQGYIQGLSAARNEPILRWMSPPPSIRPELLEAMAQGLGTVPGAPAEALREAGKVSSPLVGALRKPGTERAPSEEAIPPPSPSSPKKQEG